MAVPAASICSGTNNIYIDFTKFTKLKPVVAATWDQNRGKQNVSKCERRINEATTPSSERPTLFELYPDSGIILNFLDHLSIASNDHTHRVSWYWDLIWQKKQTNTSIASSVCDLVKKNVFKNPLQSLPVLLRHTNLHPCRLPFGSWIRFFRCSRLGLCPSESPAPSPGLAEKPLRIRKLGTMPHLLRHNNRTLKLYLDFVWVSNNAQRLVNVGSLRGILD